MYTLPPVMVVPARDPHYQKLYRAVRKVYPYAYMAAYLYRAVEDSLRRAQSSRARERYLRMMERVLKERFAQPLKQLTVYQGKVLVLLIARETGHSVYDLIRRYKSGLSARYWQTLGSFLGYDLKIQYHADSFRLLEAAIQQVELEFTVQDRLRWQEEIAQYLREVSLQEIALQIERRRNAWWNPVGWVRKLRAFLGGSSRNPEMQEQASAR